jgi:hypothetical protein
MNNTTLKIAQLLQSRTFWTIVVIVIGNILNVKYGLVNANISDLGNTILGMLAAYFKVNPSQDYSATVTSLAAPTVVTPPADVINTTPVV